MKIVHIMDDINLQKLIKITSEIINHVWLGNRTTGYRLDLM